MSRYSAITDGPSSKPEWLLQRPAFERYTGDRASAAGTVKDAERRDGCWSDLILGGQRGGEIDEYGSGRDALDAAAHKLEGYGRLP